MRLGTAAPNVTADVELALASAPQWAGDPVRSRRLISYFQTCSTPRQTERILRMAFTSDISDVQTTAYNTFPDAGTLSDGAYTATVTRVGAAPIVPRV